MTSGNRATDNRRTVVDHDDLPDHLFRWTEAVRLRVRRDLEPRLRGRPAVPGGRGSRLLELIPAEGMRITDLADRAMVTKQSLGQLVNTLESAGLVASRPDLSDARVRVVARTREGDRLVRQLDDAIAEVETAFAQQVGPRRYATMKAVLRELGAGQI